MTCNFNFSGKNEIMDHMFIPSHGTGLIRFDVFVLVYVKFELF